MMESITYSVHQLITDAMAEDTAAVASLAAMLAEKACRRDGVTRTGDITHRVIQPAEVDGHRIEPEMPDGTVVPALPLLVVDFPADREGVSFFR